MNLGLSVFFSYAYFVLQSTKTATTTVAQAAFTAVDYPSHSNSVTSWISSCRTTRSRLRHYPLPQQNRPSPSISPLGNSKTCLFSSSCDHEENNIPQSLSAARPSLLSRRLAMQQSVQQAALLSALVTGMVPPLDAASALTLASEEGSSAVVGRVPAQRIVMTGANSGIGYDAAKRMARQGHEIILACRSFSKAQDAALRMQEELYNDGETINVRVIPKECDLADLKSIQRFVMDLATDESEIASQSIDALCLNAGIARNTASKDVLRTKQNFELTVGTNHLGHFYLTDLMLNHPQKLMKDNGRIVVTASGVHDPESPGGAQGKKATLGDLKGLERAVERGDGVFDMVDGGEFDADKAYKDSKLCNVLFMRELQRRLWLSSDQQEIQNNGNARGRGIRVNAFNPGLIVSTGLFRDQNPIFTKIFDVVATDLFKVGETVHWGGGALEYMTLSDDVGSTRGGLYYTSPPGSSKYGDDAFGNQFTVSDVSKEASDVEKGKRLWELSEKLVAQQQSL